MDSDRILGSAGASECDIVDPPVQHSVRLPRCHRHLHRGRTIRAVANDVGHRLLHDVTVGPSDYNLCIVI